MIPDLASLYDSAEVNELVRKLDTARLSAELGADVDTIADKEGVSRLRVAAYLALADLIGDTQADSILREFANNNSPTFVRRGADTTFQKWGIYIRTLHDLHLPATVDSYFQFATAGLLAREPIEVRTVLRQDFARQSVREEAERSRTAAWSERVRRNITMALLLLIRQDNYADVTAASDIIRRIANDQHEVEEEWLSQRANQQRSATVLLGLYHLAEAAIRLSEFIRIGSVQIEGKVQTDFGTPLRRLIVRAEEYLQLAGDLEILMWLNCVAVVMWRLTADSIWAAGRGISPRIDALLLALSNEGRERPILSLLPSQQDAISKSLLDPSKLAVVLQMPTSAGKTLLAEFAIVEAFETYGPDIRVVYLVPTRALATQIRRTLAEDLGPIGIQTAAAGSAFQDDPYELHLLSSADGVIVATPEKLDLLLRAHSEWFEKLRLVVVDEAHLLQDGERGVRLELLLANLRRERPEARLLLLTPFVDNAAEIAAWLGGTRALAIEVHWRPSRLLLGLVSIRRIDRTRNLDIEWNEPHEPTSRPGRTSFELNIKLSEIATTAQKVIHLATQFQHLGTLLALFTAAPADAEDAAGQIADLRSGIPAEQQTPALRVAIALARNEYGPESTLARCLEKGVAYHHAALSPIMRYLIEDQVRAKKVDFIAATTTLAQGVNFPVAVVLVHSVHKPYGGGPLSAAEFWNIAGRAGRVGLVDKGLVIFANPKHRAHYERYGRELSQSVRSALLSILRSLSVGESTSGQYRLHEELRPFIQYLAHAAATESPKNAMAQLEELIQASLANVQVSNNSDARLLRNMARKYLLEISEKQQSYLKSADASGLASFSFDQLFLRVGQDPVLRAGPGAVMQREQEGLSRLINVLKDLPELNLAIGFGSGSMNVDAVARVVQGWIDGKGIPELAGDFPGATEAERIRRAATYVFGKVSQTVSWGAHAYLRGWAMRRESQAPEPPPAETMFPSYIQYGVKTPEAAVASLLGMPRQFAEPFAATFRERNGPLTPENSLIFKQFIEGAEPGTWTHVVGRSALSNQIDPADVRAVWRQTQGML